MRHCHTTCVGVLAKETKASHVETYYHLIQHLEATCPEVVSKMAFRPPICAYLVYPSMSAVSEIDLEQLCLAGWF